MTISPVIWVLSDDKAGTRAQALALAAAVGGPVRLIHARARWPWRWLPARLWRGAGRALREPLAPPWPDLVIAAGRQAVAPAAWIKRQAGPASLVVALQNPRLPLTAFDLVIVPAHDGVHGANVLVTLGALSKRDAPAGGATPAGGTTPAGRWRGGFASGDHRPVVAVMIGGRSQRYDLPPARAGEIADQLAALAANYRVVVTASRRTGPAALAVLRARLAGSGVWLWDGTGENPYPAMLWAADHVLVTADSVSMLCEAASTGKPVHMIDLPGRPGKFARFHAALAERGCIRPFTGTGTLAHWTYPPLDDTARAAAAVRDMLAGRKCEE